jgi:hypothetical protein
MRAVILCNKINHFVHGLPAPSAGYLRHTKGERSARREEEAMKTSMIGRMTVAVAAVALMANVASAAPIDLDGGLAGSIQLHNVSDPESRAYRDCQFQYYVDHPG